MNVLLIGPFNPNGRYVGGVSKIINDIYGFVFDDVNFIKFETCRIVRSQEVRRKINFQNLKNFYECRKCLKYVIDDNIDVAYIHSSFGIAFYKDLLLIKTIKLKNPNVKTIIHIHFADINVILPQNNFIRKMCINLIRNYVDKCVFLSKDTESSFKSLITGLNSKTIYNYYKNNEFASISSNNCQKNNLCFIGSLDKRKGIVDLLKALSNIDAPYVLHLCGDYTDSSIQSECKELISEYKMNVVEHGYVDDDTKYKILSTCKSLILPSYGEGLPLVILEGIYSGCYIISTTVGAIPEIITDEKIGVLIEPSDISNLENTIKNVLFDRKVDRDYIKRYSLKFSFDNFKREIKDLLEEFK